MSSSYDKMDTSYSANIVSVNLGTSIHRVLRAAQRLGLRLTRGPGGYSISDSQYQKLVCELGVTPRVRGLTSAEVRVLAVLARAPLGLPSARVIAAHAGASPTATSQALKSLLARELVISKERVLAMGEARRVRLYYANVAHPQWSEVAPQISCFVPPGGHENTFLADAVVPKRLRHLFWNTHPSQLVVDDAGEYIARRLLTTEDVGGLAWGVDNLRAEDWLGALESKGISDGMKSFARSLASAHNGSVRGGEDK